MKNMKTIYELLSIYSKEEVDDVIKNLNEEDKNLLYLRYGNDLNNPNPSNWNPKYNGRFYISLVKKIEKMIINIRNKESKKTIYELLNNYTKEEINDVIKNLNEEDKKLIYSTFGNDLSISTVVDSDTKKLLVKIRNFLKCKKEGRQLINGKLQRHIYTIYEILKDYSEEEIDNVLESLDNKDKNLLYLRYGSDLHNPDSSNWSMDYHIEFYKKLLPKLRNRLKNKKEGKPLINGKVQQRIYTIYELLSGFSKEEIDDVIKNLNEKDKHIIYLRYGSDLNNPNSSNWSHDYEYQYYKRILPKIRMTLKRNKEDKQQTSIHTIYEILKDYSEKEIDDVIENLNEKDKHVIYLRYGSDLHNPDFSNWSHDYKNQYYNGILPKIKRALKRNKEDKQKGQTSIHTIYEILKDYSEEEIDDVLESLDNKDKNLLYLRYGSDLHNPDSSNWSMDYCIEFYKILLPKLKRRLYSKKKNELILIYQYFAELQKEELKFEDKVVKNVNLNLLKKVKIIIQELKKPEYQTLLEIFSLKEILIILLLKRLDTTYDINDILKLFNMKLDELNNIVKKMKQVLKYQEKNYFESVSNAFLEDSKVK